MRSANQTAPLQRVFKRIPGSKLIRTSKAPFCSFGLQFDRQFGTVRFAELAFFFARRYQKHYGRKFVILGTHPQTILLYAKPWMEKPDNVQLWPIAPDLVTPAWVRKFAPIQHLFGGMLLKALHRTPKRRYTDSQLQQLKALVSYLRVDLDQLPRLCRAQLTIESI